MLQRIQSVYLFLVFVFAILFLVFPLANFHIEGLSYPLTLSGMNLPEVYHQVVSLGFWYYLVLGCFFAVLVFTVYTTFQYRRRLLQIRLGKMNIFLHVAMVAGAFFLIDHVREQLEPVTSTYGVGIFFPMISMLLLLMANRAIRKDEELVRSSSRIR